MLTKFICPECGADICVTYIEPERCYRINEKGEIERDDNNDAFGWFPEFQFHCSNDREHSIEKLEDNKFFQEWKQRVVAACIAYEDELEYVVTEGE